MKVWVLAVALCTGAMGGGQTPLSAPLTYECRRASAPLTIDGKLDDAAWKAAPWTTDFVDIEGTAKPLPRFRTRAKMLWDDDFLYVAAEMEEPEVKATLTEHDSVIFHDNDFELFLKPPGEGPGYFEFEINALNTSWDLYLNKPYREGGRADNSWDIPGLRTAVAVDGTLNKSSDADRGWTVEMAFPWSAFRSRAAVQPPKAGTSGARTSAASSGRPDGRQKTTGSGRPRVSSTCTSPTGGASFGCGARAVRPG